MRNRQFTNHDLVRMERMARKGCDGPTIAAAIGCNSKSVYKHVGEIMRQVRKPKTRFDRDRVRRLARDRLTSREIALRVGCSRDTVFRLAGDVLRQNPPDTSVRNEIRRLAREGRSRAYIATVLGVAKSTAHRHARDIFDGRKSAQEERRLRLYDAADADGKRDLATAFGYASLRSLYVTMHHLRRRLRPEMREAA